MTKKTDDPKLDERPLVCPDAFKIKPDADVEAESIVDALYDGDVTAYDILEDAHQAAIVEAALNTIEALVVALHRAGKVELTQGHPYSPCGCLGNCVRRNDDDDEE